MRNARRANWLSSPAAAALLGLELAAMQLFVQLRILRLVHR